MDTFTVRRIIPFLLFAASQAAFAHSAGTAEELPKALHWSFEPWVVACLALSLVLYAVGLIRLQMRQKAGHRPALLRAGSFAVGWIMLVVALMSPLDALGGEMFSAHMLQHELMMLVAAPFMVMGRPFAAWAWALPQSWRQRLPAVTRHPAVSMPWTVITTPLVAWLLHAAALWLWHVPAFFEAALADDGIHAWQHASFLFSALVFWWATIGEGAARPSRGGAMLYLFTTMVHTSALGALLALSSHSWYPAYSDMAATLGFDALEDQQLGGLIMWVPGALAYVIAAIALGAQWLSRRPQPSSFKAVRTAAPDL